MCGRTAFTDQTPPHSREALQETSDRTWACLEPFVVFGLSSGARVSTEAVTVEEVVEADSPTRSQLILNPTSGSTSAVFAESVLRRTFSSEKRVIGMKI